MQLANQEAQRFNHEYVGTGHILLGLLKEGSGVGANVLKNLDIDLRKIRLEIEKLVTSGAEMVTMGKLPQTPRAKKVVEYACKEARRLNHNYVGTEHLLLGLIREQEGIAAQVMVNLGAPLEAVRAETLSMLGVGIHDDRMEPRPPAEKPAVIARYPFPKTRPEILEDVLTPFGISRWNGREWELKYGLVATAESNVISWWCPIPPIAGEWWTNNRSQ